MSQKPKWIYLCMHLHTYVYSECSREVVGSSPTRGELFSKKFRFGVLSITHTHIRTLYISTFGGLSPLSTAFSCSCTWSWLRTANTYAFLWINRQMDILQTSTRGVTYVRRTANRHYIVEVTCMSRFASSHPSQGLPTTNHYIVIFAIRNEAYLGLPIY